MNRRIVLILLGSALIFGGIIAWTQTSTSQQSAVELAQAGEILLSGKVSQSCQFGGKNLWGKVKVVNSFPDFKVKIVSSFADLHVRKVSSFADRCGRWKFVKSFHDFKIKFVTSFPDFTIKYVTSFEGVK